MGHVNNAAYLDYLEETVARRGRCRRRGRRRRRGPCRLEYLLAGGGRRGRRRGGLAGADPGLDGWAWRLADEAGTDLVRGRLGPGDLEPIDADRSGG